MGQLAEKYQNDLLKSLIIDAKENNLYIPNEIFKDLQENIKTSSHIAYAYSYYYLITYLYRYAKYGQVSYKITEENLKNILGRSNAKKLNYLTKKGGLFTQLGYIQKSSNYPVSWSMDEYGKVIFTNISTISEDKINLRNYKINVPLKAFHRTPESKDICVEDGHFYEVENTHKVDIMIFKSAMENWNIGVEGFYLYSFLKHKNDIFSRGYDRSWDSLIKDTQIKNSTLDKYLAQLERYNYIRVIRNDDFVLGRSSGEGKANTYITNPYKLLLDNPQKRITRSVVSLEEYKKKQLWLDELPF